MRQSKHTPLAQINVVPYVDVMLVLLVIFMITAPLITQGVQVDLPQAAAKSIPAREELPLIVSIDKKGQYFLNVARHPESPMAAHDLALFIAAQKRRHPNRPVFVRGDQAVDYGKVVQVMVLLQKVGADKVGLVTQPGDSHS